MVGRHFGCQAFWPTGLLSGHQAHARRSAHRRTLPQRLRQAAAQHLTHTVRGVRTFSIALLIA